MVAKLERTQSIAYQNKDQTQNPRKHWEIHITIINNNRTAALDEGQQA